MLQGDQKGEGLLVNPAEIEGTDKLARIDKDTLGLVQSILESCRCLCGRMGQCNKGHGLCGKNGDSPPVSLEDFSQICDAGMMKSRLEQSVRLVEIGQWIAELAHDIKHPTAAISTAAQTLQCLPNMGGPAHRLATIIREEINHLNKLVDGLLHVVKPKQAKFTPYDINEIIDRIMPAIKEKIVDNGNNMAVRWERPQDRAIALVDDDQMEEVFMNLAANALEAMSDGGTLSISVKVNKDSIQTAFTDTGIGVSKKDLDLIFNPFYSTKMDGVGLGLVIVKRVAEMHNGYIDVKSRADIGTTFALTLPRSVR
ncbi:PAS domain-containing sensor histidine kinase [Candidatus Poribacteria bacterium]